MVSPLNLGLCFGPGEHLQTRVFSFFILLYTLYMQQNGNSEQDAPKEQNDEILSPEKAREWLDEFLTEQQKESE